jgi:hypothetical protein
MKMNVNEIFSTKFDRRPKFDYDLRLNIAIGFFGVPVFLKMAEKGSMRASRITDELDERLTSGSSVLESCARP